MAFLQGNTYLKPVQVFDCNGNEIAIDRVARGEFTFGDVIKYYEADGSGEVVWNDDEKCFIVPLTESDTFKFDSLVECQARVVLDDGSVSGSVPESHYVYESKSKNILSAGGAGSESGKLLTLRLLEPLAVGGTSDYEKLNNLPSVNGVELVGDKSAEELGLADIEYVDKKVADLVNSAPETLDTLGEVAKAIQENESVVDALNGAIGSKASQESVDELGDRVEQLENAGQPETNFIYLVGTEDKPINFYTDLEVGKGYILKGYIYVTKYMTTNTYSNHFFAYKQSTNSVFIYNYWISRYKINGAKDVISYIKVDSAGNVTDSNNYSMIEHATSSGKILISNNSYVPEWTSMSEITEFIDLANRITALEQGGGGGLDLIRVPKEA